MSEIKFYRGTKEKYLQNKELYKDSIYFATDKHEIIHNDASYGLELDEEVTVLGENPVKGSAIYSAIQKTVEKAISETRHASSITVTTDSSRSMLFVTLNDSKGNLMSESSCLITSAENFEGGLELTRINKDTIYSRQTKDGICNIQFRTRYRDKNGEPLNKDYYYLVVAKTGSTTRLYPGEATTDEVITENIYESLRAGYTTIASTIVSEKKIIPVKKDSSEKYVDYETGSEVVLSPDFLYIYIDTLTYLEASGDEFISADDKIVRRNDTRVYLIDLSISSTFDIGTKITPSSGIKIPFIISSGTLSSILSKLTVNCWIDDINSTPVIISNTSQSTFTISTGNLSHGPHVAQIRAQYVADNGEPIYSNLLYIRFAVDNNESTPIIACFINYGDGTNLISGNPSIDIEQYESYSIDYAVYTPNSSSFVKFISNGEVIGETEQEFKKSSFSYRYLESGSKECQISSGSVKFNYTVNVFSNPSMLIDIPSPDMYLSAYGKSNDSSTRDTWSSGEITSNFSGVSFSNEDGWVTTENGERCLRLVNGGSVDINYKPLSSEVVSFFIRFSVNNISDVTKNIINCLYTSEINGREIKEGFSITSQAITLFLRNGSNSLETRFAEGKDYTVGFVSFPRENPNNVPDIEKNLGMVYLYVNGEISAAIQKGPSDSIIQTLPQTISLSAIGCTLDVFSIRGYNKTALNTLQALNCHLIDSSSSESLKEMYDKNNIFMGGYVTPESISKLGLPYFIVSGSRDNTATFLVVQESKDSSTKYDVERLLFVDPLDRTKNFVSYPKKSGETTTYPQIRIQGTSSLQYPIKNYRFYTKGTLLYIGCDETGNPETGRLEESSKYSLSEFATPVNCWCLKADYAESSSSHNTGLANLVDYYQKNVTVGATKGQLTPPQRHKSDTYEYSIRTTVEGRPCVIFYHANFIETSGYKYSLPQAGDNPKTDLVFSGKYNFNNDKSTEDVFGFLKIPGYHKDSIYSERMKELTLKSIFYPKRDNNGKLLFDSSGDLLEDTDRTEEKIALLVEAGILDLDKEGNIKSGNPTSCYEFKTNDSKMGEFTDVDFNFKKTVIDENGQEVQNDDTWFSCWEPRFPGEECLWDKLTPGAFQREDGAIAYYLWRVASWIKSTDTTEATGNDLPRTITYNGISYSKDTVDYRKAKFYHELENYFEVNFLCDYYTINDITAGVDQRVKNMMFAFWYSPEKDDMLCYPIYYDNDTIFGLDNSGALVYSWDIDENTLASSGKHAFEGHNSVLWKNLRETCQAELSLSYTRFRSVFPTDADMLKFFNENQSDKFGTALYNKDSENKYISQEISGTSSISKGHLPKLQGSRKSHREWFISNRLSLFDAKNDAGKHITEKLEFKSISLLQGGITEVVGPDGEPLKDENGNIITVETIGTGSQIMKILPYRDWYVSLYYDNNRKVHEYVRTVGRKYEDTSTWWSYEWADKTSIGSAGDLRGLRWVRGLDLSQWNGILMFQLPSCPVLEKILIGTFEHASTAANNNFVFNLNSAPALKEIRVINYTTISGVRIEKCKHLEILDLRACSNISSVSLPETSNLREIHLPSNYGSLILNSLPKLYSDKIYYEVPGTTSSTTTPSASLTTLVIENCKNINGYEYLFKILDTPNNSLQFCRIVDLVLEGNGNDLKRIMEKGIRGVNFRGQVENDEVLSPLYGTYQLNVLLPEDEFKSIREYFYPNNGIRGGLLVEQPKYTTITFSTMETTTEKISNLDNRTGYEYGNTYEPSGYVKNILNQRHSYLVKPVKSSNSNYAGAGTFVACQLSDTNSTLFSDNDTAAKLNGTMGDYCMYEPHYWYKGVNDYANKKIYAFFSTLDNVPTVAKGTKYSFSDLTLYSKNRAISTSDAFIGKDFTTAIVSNNSYYIYSYTLPENHSYIRGRVMGIASNLYGCVFCDKNNNIIRSYSARASEGMFNGSYLIVDIPTNAKSLYFTVSSDSSYNICNYALYLTPSNDIEDLEPDWVEHKECFIGRVLSTPTEDGTVSGFLTGVNDGYYSFKGNSMAIKPLCETVTLRGTGYGVFDYEAYKEIVMLGYLKYGTTYLQGIVGQGRSGLTGDFGWRRVSRYYPSEGSGSNSIQYEKYGLKDTNKVEVSKESNGVVKTYDYVSVYIKEDGVSKVFSGVSTLLGYHQFIANGGTMSDTDSVNRSTFTLTTRFGRKLKLFSNSGAYRYSTFIQGGRYLDLVGIGESEVIDETTGFCISEIAETSGGSGTEGYLICGYQGASSSTDSAACFRISANSGTAATPSISMDNLDKVLRIMITPNHLIICNDPTTYKNSYN